MHDPLSRCPVCDSALSVTRLQCAVCTTTIEGRFHLCPFCRMGREQREFALTFVRCRGNIKEVERELGISYPTVRGRLEDCLRAIGDRGAPVMVTSHASMEASSSSPHRLQVLRDLSNGRISAEEAHERLYLGPD